MSDSKAIGIMVATLINIRWVDIQTEDIYHNLLTLGLNDWHVNSLEVSGYQRHYLWSDTGYNYAYSLPFEVINRLANRLNKVKHMTWYRQYNEQAIAHFGEHGQALNQAAEYWESVGNLDLPKPEIIPVDLLANGTEYLAIIGLFHLTGAENGNNHHLFIDVIDSGGNRIYDHTPPLNLYYGWVGMTTEEERKTDPIRVDKPGNEPGANIGLTWGQVVYGFHINNVATDRFRNVHIRYENDGPGNDRGHHSHYVVYQKRIFQAGPPIDPPPIDPPPNVVKGMIEISVDKELINSLPVDEQGRIKLIVPIYR